LKLLIKCQQVSMLSLLNCMCISQVTSKLVFHGVYEFVSLIYFSVVLWVLSFELWCVFDTSSLFFYLFSFFFHHIFLAIRSFLFLSCNLDLYENACWLLCMWIIWEKKEIIKIYWLCIYSTRIIVHVLYAHINYC